MSGHPCDGVRVEERGIVGELDLELVVEVGAQGQCEVGGVDGLEFADVQAVVGDGLLIEGLVLENDHTIEQVGAGGQITPGL